MSACGLLISPFFSNSEDIVAADLHHDSIVSDIGGTHARFDRWSVHSGLSDNLPTPLANDAFRDPAARINRYRRDAADQ